MGKNKVDFKSRMNASRKQQLRRTAAIAASLVLVSSPVSIVAKEGLSHVDLFSPSVVSAAEAPTDMLENTSVEVNEEAGSEAKVESDPEVNEEANSEAKVESGPKVNEEADSEANVEAEPEVSEKADPEANVESEPEVNEEVDSEANVESDPEASTEAEPEVSEKAGPEANVESEPEVSEKAEPEVSEKAEPEVSTEAEPEVSEKAEPEVSTEAEPEASREAEPEVEEKVKPKINKVTKAVDPKASSVSKTAEPSVTLKVADTKVTGSNATYTWEEKSDGTILITKYKGSKKDIVIPEKINGKKVTAISHSAFAKKGLTSLTLPEGIESIYPNAFEENKLVNLVIPNSVREIGNYAFAFNKINNLIIGNGVKVIYEYAFFENELTIVDLPNTVETIDQGAFAHNKIEKIVLRNNLKHIYDYAFFQNNIKKVDLPASLETLDGGAFSRNKLTEVSIRSKDVALDGDGLYFFMNPKGPGNLIIRGYANSTAEAMAKKFGFIFIATKFTEKDNSGDEKKKPIVVTPGKKVSVKGGDTITIKGDKQTTFTLPKELPAGVKMTIVPVKDLKNLNGLELAGLVYKFDFEGLGNYSGTFKLEMVYDTSKYNANEVDIYYYDEEQSVWMPQGGTVHGDKISIIIDHFSTYGVFALVTKDPVDPVAPVDSSDPVDPGKGVDSGKEKPEMQTATVGPSQVDETQASNLVSETKRRDANPSMATNVYDEPSQSKQKMSETKQTMNKLETSQVMTEVASDNELPDTATSTSNWLVAGLIALFAGIGGLFTRRKKKE